MKLFLPSMARMTATLAATGLLCLAQNAVAQAYPTRAVKVLVPYAPGGGVDFVSRIVAQQLSEALGQPFVIENKPGGGTNIAAEQVARSAPDGYTLFAASRANAVNATLYKKLSFDIEKDFAPISILSDTPNILVVTPSLPAKNLQELIALAKAQPGKLSFASAGTAGSTHLAGELFKSMAGVNIVHVPYRGGAPAAVDLISGQVQMYFGTMPSVMNFVRAGKLRAIGVTSLKRAEAEPSYPTLSELGLTGYRETSWVGFMAPAGTPPAIINRLNAEIVRILNKPEIKNKLRGEGGEIVGNTPAEFAAFLRKDIATTAVLIKDANITVD
jgi:tripartite-type tricarboxylate transporter receptor subunit TctC